MARRSQRRLSAIPPPLPRHGDLVVAPFEGRWAVAPFGSRAQVSFATREAALAHAHAFAAGRSLGVWVTDDGVAHTRDREKRGNVDGRD